jgi:hypothetical protein
MYKFHDESIWTSAELSRSPKDKVKELAKDQRKEEG